MEETEPENNLLKSLIEKISALPLLFIFEDS
jgi:hypothetical protein